MNIQLLSTSMNIMIFILMIFRIITWRRLTSRHKPLYSWIAWLLCMCGFIIITCLILGHYRVAEWAETLINAVLCCSLFYNGGNIADLFKEKK